MLQRRWYKDGSTWKQGADDLAGTAKLPTRGGQRVQRHDRLTEFTTSLMGASQIHVQQGNSLGSIAQRVYGSQYYW